jgi:hypothetical protein
MQRPRGSKDGHYSFTRFQLAALECLTELALLLDVEIGSLASRITTPLCVFYDTNKIYY